MNRRAASCASVPRTPGALNTTQCSSASGCALSSSSTEPPHPISMSSECAPRNRTLSGPASALRGENRSPEALTSGGDRCRCLRRVHRHPETVVRVREQLVLLHESAERLLDELFAFLDVVEDLTAEREEPGVDA